MEHESQLLCVAPWIFSIIVGTNTKGRMPFGEQGNRTKNVGLRDRSLLIKATEILKEFITREGSVQKKRLKLICGDFEYTPLVPGS